MEWFRIPTPVAELIESGIEENVAHLRTTQTHFDLVNPDQPFPTAGGINDVLRTYWDSRFERKVLQGFDTLLIIPNAGYHRLMNALQQVILTRAGGDGIQTPWGEKLDIDTNQSVRTNWNELSELMYRLNGEWMDATTFYAHQLFPGYDVVLIRSADVDLPREGSGTSTFGRPDTEGGTSPLKHREMFGTAPYEHECCLSTDGNLMYYLESIRGGVAPDVWTKERGTTVRCSENQFKMKDMESAYAGVPLVFFNRYGGRAIAGVENANYSDGSYAVRAAVRIVKP